MDMSYVLKCLSLKAMPTGLFKPETTSATSTACREDLSVALT